MKLAYITTLAGTQFQFLRGQNHYMAARGMELHAISSPGAVMDDLVKRDVVTPHPIPIARHVRPVSDLISFVRLYFVLRKIRPDIVHVSTSKAALLGAAAAWCARVPVRIFFVRGLASEKAPGLTGWMFRQLEWLTARLCTASICVSHSLLRYAQEHGILRKNEGVVMANGMSNGIDVTRFDPDTVAPAELRAVQPNLPEDFNVKNAPVIGFSGRLARDKGIEEIAAAWRLLREEFPEAVLLICGAWESACSVDPEVRTQLESDPRVIMPGLVLDMERYYRCMDVLLLPTHGTEGFPNSPMEAGAMEVPAIVSNVVGCRDAVEPNHTGLLMEPGDTQSLIRGIRDYLTNPALRKRHGRNARRRIVAMFQHEPIWDELFTLYESLHAARARRDKSPQRMRPSIQQTWSRT